MCMMILLNEKLSWVCFIQLKIRILMFWVFVLKFGFKYVCEFGYDFAVNNPKKAGPTLNETFLGLLYPTENYKV